jgi:hypothetical protein
VLLLGWCFEIFPKKSLTKSNTLTFGTAFFYGRWLSILNYFQAGF